MSVLSVATGLHIPACRAVVETTIAQGVFRQQEFRQACLSTWEVSWPLEDHCLEVAHVDLDARFDAFLQVRDRLESAVANAPRGHWALLVREHVHHAGCCPEAYFTALMSDGLGSIREVTDWDQSSREPTFSEIAEQLVRMEIFRARQAVEQERRTKAAISMIKTRGWRVGSKLPSVRLGVHRFSSAIVQSIDWETGYVTLLGTKRGSKQRWEGRVMATGLTFI